MSSAHRKPKIQKPVMSTLTPISISIQLPSFEAMPEPLFAMLSDQVKNTQIISSFDLSTRTWYVDQATISEFLHASANRIVEALMMFMAQEDAEAQARSPIILRAQ